MSSKSCKGALLYSVNALRTLAFPLRTGERWHIAPGRALSWQIWSSSTQQDQTEDSGETRAPGLFHHLTNPPPPLNFPCMRKVCCCSNDQLSGGSRPAPHAEECVSVCVCVFVPEEVPTLPPLHSHFLHCEDSLLNWPLGLSPLSMAAAPWGAMDLEVTDANGSNCSSRNESDRGRSAPSSGVSSALASVLIFTIVVDILGNILVILSVCRNKKLRNAGEAWGNDPSVECETMFVWRQDWRGKKGFNRQDVGTVWSMPML